MEKITVLSDLEYQKIAKGRQVSKSLRKILDIPDGKEMQIGDSVCMVGQPSKRGDVFRYVQNDRIIYYVVVSPMDEQMAMCYTIYPC